VSKSLVLSKADKLRLIELRGKLKSKAKQLQESGSSSSHSVGNDFLSASADGWSNVGSVTSHHPSKSGPSVRANSSNSSNTSGNSTSVPNTATGPRSRPLPFFNHALSNNNPAPAQFEAINEDGPMSPGIAALRSGGPDDDDEDNALRGGRRGVSFQDEKSAVNDAEGMATLPTVSAHARACGLAFVRSRCRVRPYGLLGEGCSSSTPPATSEQKFAHATAEAPPADMTAPGSAGPDPTQESGVCLLEPVGMHKPVGALGAWLFGSAEAAAAHPPRPEVVRAVQGAGHAKHAVYAKRLGSVGHSWRANALEVHVIHAAAPDLKRTRGFSLSRSGSLARSQPGSLARAHSRQGSLARSNPANSSSGSGGGGGGVGMGVCAGSETVSQLSPREGYNEVLAALAGTYRAVLVEFSGSGQRVLRLLPLSSGAQAGPWVQSLPRVTFDALELAFALLPASDQVRSSKVLEYSITSNALRAALAAFFFKPKNESYTFLVSLFALNLLDVGYIISYFTLHVCAGTLMQPYMWVCRLLCPKARCTSASPIRPCSMSLRRPVLAQVPPPYTRSLKCLLRKGLNRLPLLPLLQLQVSPRRSYRRRARRRRCPSPCHQHCRLSSPSSTRLKAQSRTVGRPLRRKKKTVAFECAHP